jgi:hypothetical protein
LMVKHALLSEMHSLSAVRGLVEQLKCLTESNFISFSVFMCRETVIGQHMC